MEYVKDLTFYKSRQERGFKTPLDELIPTRDDLVVWFLKTFQTLERSRQPNGRIPLSEILIYTDYFDIMCPMDQFVRTIGMMDDTILAYEQQQAKKINAKQKQKQEQNQRPR